MRKLLDPLYEWMKQEVLESKVIGTDDTSVKVLDPSFPSPGRADLAVCGRCSPSGDCV